MLASAPRAAESHPHRIDAVIFIGTSLRTIPDLDNAPQYTGKAVLNDAHPQILQGNGPTNHSAQDKDPSGVCPTLGTVPGILPVSV